MVGLQHTIVRTICSHPARSSFITRRLISNSSSLNAEHANYSSRPKASPSLSSRLDERSGYAQPHSGVEYDTYGNQIDPYKNGPSALDKAVHLFFFTEIIRGRSLP